MEELARNLEKGLVGWLAIHDGVSLQKCIIVETDLDLIRVFQTQLGAQVRSFCPVSGVFKNTQARRFNII
jgi:hypothetical protein